MRRKTVSSSMIASVGYAAKTRVLEIEFLSGRIYQYFEVDRDTYGALLKASSIGTYFNAYIRDEYSFVRTRVMVSRGAPAGNTWNHPRAGAGLSGEPIAGVPTSRHHLAL